MAKKQNKIGISLLYGLTFLSPITFSVMVYYLDVIQRMVFFSASLLLFLIFILRYKFEQPIQLNKMLVIVFLIFPFTFLTSLLNNSATLLLLKFSDIIIPLSVLLQSMVLFLILGEDKFFKVVSLSVVAVSTVFSLIGILEVFEIKIITLPTAIAPGSTLGHRGFAAEFLLSAIPFYLIANNYVNKDLKKFLFISAIINVTFLLFTRSRAGILILFFVAVIYLVFILITKEKSSRTKFLRPVFAILAISLLISLIPVKIGERPDLQSTAASFFDENFKSNLLRLNFWDASLQMMMEDPLTGKGLYKWSGYYPKYAGDYFDDKNLFLVHNIHAHNDFLEIFAESGVAAAIIFFLMFTFAAVILLKTSRSNEKYFSLLLTIVITFSFSFISFPNYKFASYFLAAVVSGVALVQVTGNQEKTFAVNFDIVKWILLSALLIGGLTSYIKLKSELSYGQAMYLKERKQAVLMLQKLDEISDELYPFDVSKQPVEHYRGIANSYLSRFNEALKNNLKAKDLAPYNPLVWRNIAGAYQALDNFQKAIEQYELIKIQFPNYINAQINLLELYIKSDNKEKAYELYKQLVEKSPDNPKLLQYIEKFRPE